MYIEVRSYICRDSRFSVGGLYSVGFINLIGVVAGVLPEWRWVRMPPP
jgi:hypothetical protein